jgi:hypothetical protein
MRAYRRAQQRSWARARQDGREVVTALAIGPPARGRASRAARIEGRRSRRARGRMVVETCGRRRRSQAFRRCAAVCRGPRAGEERGTAGRDVAKGARGGGRERSAARTRTSLRKDDGEGPARRRARRAGRREGRRSTRACPEVVSHVPPSGTRPRARGRRVVELALAEVARDRAPVRRVRGERRSRGGGQTGRGDEAKPGRAGAREASRLLRGRGSSRAPGGCRVEPLLRCLAMPRRSRGDAARRAR